MAQDDETAARGREGARRALQLMWGAVAEPTRGPRPALSVERIVRAAIEMADAEGLVALSMRRIATALGVGAMSLYRYIPNKAVLVDLMIDEVYREAVEAAETVTGDWRERLAAYGRQERDLYLRHPWVLQVPQGRPMLGPNAMTSTDIALQAVDDLGLSEDEMLSTVVLISSFVSGLAKTIIEANQAAASTGIADDEWWEIQGEFVGPAVVAGQLPMLTKVGDAGAFMSDFDSFEFGLQRLLDGIEAMVAARKAESRAQGKPLSLRETQ
jgi:AcrR family transcriptional regulator